MTIDQSYTLNVPVAANDGKSVVIVPVSVAVRVRAESEVAARIVSGNTERAFRNSIYADAEESK